MSVSTNTELRQAIQTVTSGTTIQLDSATFSVAKLAKIVCATPLAPAGGYINKV
jgi:hypothetical protein